MTAHLKNPSKTPSRLSLRDQYRFGGPLACRRSSCVPFDNHLFHLFLEWLFVLRN